MPCHTRTPGRLAARTLAPTAICHGLTAQRSDARTRAHTPAVYHTPWTRTVSAALGSGGLVACHTLRRSIMLAAGCGGQWWQSLPVVLCYACSYLPGVMLASGGSLCRGQSLGGQPAASARSYIQPGRLPSASSAEQKTVISGNHDYIIQSMKPDITAVCMVI